MLIQGWAEQRIVGTMTMALDGRSGRIDLLVQLLLLACLGELRIPFGREDFIDALVVTAPDIPDQVPQLRRIADGLCGELANLRRFSSNHQTSNRFSVVAVNGGLE